MIDNRKKGFTLLELIISMAIITLVFSLGLKGVRISEKIKNNIRANAAINEISDFLSYSKLYCDKNNTSVIIYCKNNGKVEFRDVTNGFAKKITLPIGFTFITNYNINCSNNGVLAPGSMYIRDKYGEFYKLTISVGVDNINIYYEE